MYVVFTLKLIYFLNFFFIETLEMYSFILYELKSVHYYMLKKILVLRSTKYFTYPVEKIDGQANYTTNFLTARMLKLFSFHNSVCPEMRF